MGRFTAVLTVAGVALGCGRLSFDAHNGANGDARRGGGNPDVPTEPFCASQTGATFCTDFANGSAGWDNDERVNGSYAFEPSGGPTPLSGALVVTTNSSVTPAQVSLVLGHAAPAASLAFSFDVRIDVAGVGAPALGHVVFDGATASHGVEYVHIPGGPANLEEIIVPDGQSGMFLFNPVPSFPANEWHRVSVNITIGNAWTATVEIDGLQPTGVLLQDTTNGIVAFSVGVSYLADASSPWVIRFSNVVLDVQ